MTGGKKTRRRSAGDEARSARTDGDSCRPRRARSTRCWRALDGLKQEIIGFEAELERLRALQQSREKDRVALDHEMRKLGEDLARTNSRLSVARLELERLRRDAEKIGRAARAQSQPRWRRRSGSAPRAREALEAERQRAGEARRPGRDDRGGARRHARRTGRAGRAAPRRARRRWARLEAAVPRDHAIAATRSRRRSSAWANERARLLADNIELDQKVGRARRADHGARSPGERDGHAGRRHARRAARRRRGAEGAPRAAVQEAQEKRSQIEVDLVRKQAELKYLDETSRKELNCAGGGAGRRRTSPIPDADAIAEAEQQCQRSAATASKRWAR